MKTSCWSDFWYGFTVLWESVWESAKDFTRIRDWDWETLGWIAGGVLFVSMIIVPLAYLFHWILP
jgi:hypothetical protein